MNKLTLNVAEQNAELDAAAAGHNNRMQATHRVVANSELVPSQAEK